MITDLNSIMAMDEAEFATWTVQSFTEINLDLATEQGFEQAAKLRDFTRIFIYRQTLHGNLPGNMRAE
jgi:hypothetical protein